MERRNKWLICLVLMCAISCTHKSKVDTTGSNYPPQIANIILNKCALSGCHNNLSYVNADELNLTTWDSLFMGSSTGSTVVPYRPDFSSMCFFTNTFSDLGITLQPTMPYTKTPLSKDEYLTLKNWIAAGAPGADGRIKYADDPSRRKFYIANWLCSVVTVIDEASLLQMRFIDVGDNNISKYPYCVKVSPDKKYWYVSFFTQSAFVQKFNAADDKLVGEINLGPGVWTSFQIAADSRYAWFIDNSNPGKIAYADLDSMVVLSTYTFDGNFKYPTGIALNEQLNKMYVGVTNGNFVYNIDITNPLSPIIHEMPIDGSTTVQFQSSVDPVELIAYPQTGKCYMACVASGEVRVFDMAHDALLNNILLDTGPAFMGISGTTQKLFVSCPDDTTFPGNRGSVAIIDMQTNTIIKRVNTGYQPYGIAVDDDKKVVAVVNANISSAGPASHHVSGCGKKNGNITFIDLNTLSLVHQKLLEVAVFPFSAALR